MKDHGRLPTLYASQAYDAAMLMDSAVRMARGRIEDKEALGKAFMAANFKSVRGDFKFNRNHFPIQNYYTRVIGKDAEGRITNRTLGVVLFSHSDAYAAACKMK
jgi:branched-chain amino acid transport system substrate-binding protein